MMTDSHFSISSFSHHKSGAIRRQVGVGADTAYPLNNMRETAGACRRPAPENPRRILKNKGSPLCLEKPIKFSPRKSCAKLRHHVTHSQIMRSTRKSFANHPQIIRKSFANHSQIIRKSSAIHQHTAIRITTTAPRSHTTPSSAAGCAKHAEFKVRAWRLKTWDLK